MGQIVRNRNEIKLVFKADKHVIDGKSGVRTISGDITLTLKGSTADKNSYTVDVSNLKFVIKDGTTEETIKDLAEMTVSVSGLTGKFADTDGKKYDG